MTTVAQNTVEALPLEIWARCIAEACHGEHYMTSLLAFTTVSKTWSYYIVNTPSLWANIHVNDADGDSMATIAAFLHLSGSVQLSLTIRVPLSRNWDAVVTILIPHRDRIRDITIQSDYEDHSKELRRKRVTDDEIRSTMSKLVQDLHFLNASSIKYLDVDIGRPVELEVDWVPPNIISGGHWIFPLGPTAPIFPQFMPLDLSIRRSTYPTWSSICLT